VTKADEFVHRCRWTSPHTCFHPGTGSHRLHYGAFVHRQAFSSSPTSRAPDEVVAHQRWCVQSSLVWNGQPYHSEHMLSPCQTWALYDTSLACGLSARSSPAWNGLAGCFERKGCQIYTARSISAGFRTCLFYERQFFFYIEATPQTSSCARAAGFCPL